MLGMAGFPGVWATWPANTVVERWAKIVTPAFPAPPGYSQTMPPPGIGVEVGPVEDPPSAVLACASVGHVAAVVAAAAVVGTASVVAVVDGAEAAEVAAVLDGGGDVEVVKLVLPDPHPASNKPIESEPPASNTRLMRPTLRRGSTRDKWCCGWGRTGRYDSSDRRMWMAGNPSKWSPAAVMASAMCGEAIWASRSSLDSHFSVVTNVPGAESDANRS